MPAVIQWKQSAGVRTACAGMATHKFRVGEKVQFLAGLGVRFATSEIYEIVQQLPQSNGEYHYKIKSVDEPHLRMAKESQLRRA